MTNIEKNEPPETISDFQCFRLSQTIAILYTLLLLSEAIIKLKIQWRSIESCYQNACSDQHNIYASREEKKNVKFV